MGEGISGLIHGKTWILRNRVCFSWVPAWPQRRCRRSAKNRFCCRQTPSFLPKAPTDSNLGRAGLADSRKVRDKATAELIQGGSKSLPLLRCLLLRNDEALRREAFEILRHIGAAASSAACRVAGMERDTHSKAGNQRFD